MNLNEYMINPKNKSKKTKFIATERCEPSCSNAARSAKKSVTDRSSSNWGSAFASIVTTPSSRRSSDWRNSDKDPSKIVVALTEGRGQARCEVGIAVIKTSNPTLILCQISDTQSYTNTLTKINIFNPTEIIYPKTFETSGGSRLLTKIRNQFPTAKYFAVQRRWFNNKSGLDMISKLCIPSLNGIILVLQQRYYALAATSALISYIQDNLYIFYASESLKIDYQESEGYALIDVATADRLELVCSAKPCQANKYSSLFGILNQCYTKMGTRMLRSWILQPLFKVEFINARLNCVDELIKNRQTLTNTQISLQKLTTIDSLLNLPYLLPEDPQKSCSVRQLNYLMNLNNIIDFLSPLHEMVASLKQPFFVQLQKTLKDPSFVKIKSMVRDFMVESSQLSKGNISIDQRCYCIKPGVNQLLDVVRKIYSERIHDMADYVKLLSEKYNLPFTLGNNAKKGYHIVLNLNKQMRNMKKSDLPPEFLEVQGCAQSFTMKTPNLVNISTRVEAILEDILKISNTVLYEIIVKLKKYMPVFYTLCEELAQLDVYQSLAQVSLENNYIRPEFGDYTEIKNGEHPMLSFLLPSKPVANSLFCSDDYNVHVITGPNGSGKSIFIRQIMLLQIMAQLGTYVPAEFAIFKPVNKMFARIYLDDNMDYNASSFVLEMKEIKCIMSTMTSDSLVIIDELGRSTSVEEGVSIAIAILEKLSLNRSFYFVTTHFKMLTNISSMYPHIKSWQMETIPSGEDPKTFKLDYKYSLVAGVTKVQRYGVYIVRNIWPESIIKVTDASLDRFEKRQERTMFTPLDEKFVLKYNIESSLRQLKRQDLFLLSTVKQALNIYEIKLKQLNYTLKNLTFSTKTANNPTENDLVSIISSQDCFRNQQTFNFTFSEDHKEELLNDNSYQSDNTEFMKLLHPLVTITEDYSHKSDFQHNDSPLQSTSSKQLDATPLYRYTDSQPSENITQDCFRNLRDLMDFDTPLNITNNNENLGDNFENLGVFSLTTELAEASYIDEESGSIEDVNRYRNYEIPSFNNKTINNPSKPKQTIEVHEVLIVKSINDTVDSDADKTFLSGTQSVINDNEYRNLKFNFDATKTFNNCDNIVSFTTSKEQESNCILEDRNVTHANLNTENENKMESSDVAEIVTKKHFFQNSKDVSKNEQHKSNGNITKDFNNTCLSSHELTQVSSTMSQYNQITDKKRSYHHRYISPVVNIIEGPNDTSISQENSNEDNRNLIFTSTPKECLLRTQTSEQGESQNSVLNQSNIGISEQLSTHTPRPTPKEHCSPTSNLFRQLKELKITSMYKQQDEPQEFNPVISKKVKNNLICNAEKEGFNTSLPLSMQQNVNEELNVSEKCHNTPNSKIEDKSLEPNTAFPPNNSSKVVSSQSSRCSLDAPGIKDTDFEVNDTSLSSASKKRKIDSSPNSTDMFKKPNSEEQSQNSISSASKKRNLDISLSSDSSDLNPALPSTSFANQSSTSISSASKKRNLDSSRTSYPSTDSSFKNPYEPPPKKRNLNTSNSSESSSIIKPSSFKRKKTPPLPIFQTKKPTECDLTPQSSCKSFHLDTHNFTSNAGPKKPLRRCMQKFVPPKKLSAKKIRQEFDEQDRELLSSSPSSSNISKYVEQRMNRPTVKQIQSATYLGAFRKTTKGFEFVSKPEAKSKKKFPMSFSNESVDMTIFSDRNANAFDQFINSSETNFRNFFNFNSQKEMKAASSSNQNVDSIFDYYINNSQGNAQGTPSTESLTPSGYYKDNKATINELLKKYSNM